MLLEFRTNRGAKRRRHLVAGLVVSLILGATIASYGCRRSSRAISEPVVLRVASDGEFLAFAPTELSCPAGARVRVLFHHAGRRLPQEHNWVLTLPGTAEAVAEAGATAGAAAGFVRPGDKRVLAATSLCGPGGDAAVEFTAPAAGDYPFVCTFPGHAAEMHGLLHVTNR